MLVYAASDRARSHLWLRVLGDGTSRPLEGTEDARFPFWSPDSQSIAFFADGRMKILDVAGRSVRTLVNAIGVGGTWNRDGVIVYSPSGVNPLSRVTSTGRAPQPATELLPSQRGHSFPQFLPDDRHFLFFASGPPDTRGVYVGELDSLAVRRLVDADGTGTFVAPDQLLFMRQGALLAQRFDLERLAVAGVPEVIAEQVATDSNRWRAAVSADDLGTIAYRLSGGGAERRHIWFDRSGKELGAVGDASFGGNTATLSPDQKRIAVPRQVDGNTDIWILDIARGIFDRFTFHPTLESHPLWSPDGTRIVFQRFNEGRGDLFIKSISGNGDDQLVLTNPRGKIPTDWSSDGQFVLYKEGSATGQQGWDIFAFRVDGDRTPIPVAQTGAEERDGQFSPDGKWVAYQSDESGEFAIFVRPFQRAGNKQRISPGFGAQVRWRADGNELFYLTLDCELISVPIRLDPGGETIEAGKPTALFKTRVADVVLAIARQQYTPSPDGQRFLMHTITREATTPPVTVILNRKARAATSGN
jgi:Tol biopolymer transport system component